MHDSLFVRDIECIRNLARDGEDLIHRESARYFLCKRLTFDQFQNQRTSTSRLLEAIDRTDVRMVQRCEDSSFSFESYELIGIGDEFTRENLDGDIATESCIASAIHFTHPALSQQSGNFIQADS